MATRKKAPEKKTAKAEKSIAKKPEASAAKKKAAPEASASKKKAAAAAPEASAPRKKPASAAETSVRRNAVTQESSAVTRAPRKEEISTKRSAHTAESSTAAPSAPRSSSSSSSNDGHVPAPAPFVPFVMPAPKPLALRELSEPTAQPKWETRATEPDQMPLRPNIESRLQLNFPEVLADGSAIGLERGKLAQAHVVRVTLDGERQRISKPGEYSFIALSAERASIFAVSGEKVWSFPVSADSSKAVTVFQGSGAVWNVTPLGATRAVIAQDGAIRLLDTSTTPWKELDAVSVKPISIPLVDAVDEGRWIVVGRSPKIHLFAVRDRSLVPVQSWLQVEGGVSIVDGRAFLYTAGSLVREELLNLRAVHGALG